MGRIFGFDIKLFFSKKRNWIVMTMFVIFLGLFVVTNIMMEKHYIASELSTAEWNYESIHQINQDLVNNPNYPKDKIIVREKKEQLRKGLVDAIQNGDWRAQLFVQIQIDQIDLKDAQGGNLSYTYSERVEMQQRITVNQILLEKDIKPVFTDSSMQSYHFIRTAFTNVIPIVMVLIVLLFTNDALSAEVETGTVKLLLTQPVGRARIFNAKYASRLMLSLGFFALVFGLFFVILGFIKGFGNAEYPILFYTGEYINVSDFMLLTILMAFLLIVAVNAFAMLVSVLTNNTASSLSISVIIITFLYILTYQLGVFDSFAQFNPLSYIHITEVLSGEAALRFDNNGVQYINGMITLFATMFICQISGSVIFNRKDIRS